MDKPAKEKVKEVFGRNAEKYRTSELHAKGDDLPLLAEWLEPEDAWTVLDIATGGGHVSKALAPHVKNVFSTDLTEQMLENTASHLDAFFENVFYVIADAEALPFLDNRFDAVVCRIAPHHFPHPENFIKEAARVLKPSGKFVLIDNVTPENPELAQFMNRTEKLRDDSHVRCLSKAEWTELLHQHGLVQTKSLDRKKTFQYPSWVARTTESEEQRERVKRHLLSADRETAGYFSLNIQGDAIQSFTIDEWMVMCIKEEA
ncbi:class I SAM-dependent methyltransferase [Planomicrobium sp. CPCC 101110]|uniref:class I SAM-dependent methyltransferase n=1 Tax=Planomicrobium sp. CPCC 101110 TaxID=2599619 RepID=UPI0011B7565E|nr:methyltransferase domain-containing protein [Planomicrobium sp. CPCC 101110]TWT27489.1 methyltransferase domain-containing protein [Planomicrobium sp. CPCC 101110]